MSLIVATLLICLLPTSVWTQSLQISPPPRRVCEGSILRLSCDRNNYIHVVTASYGRNAGSEICPHSYIRVTSGCHASSSLSRVRSACEGQRSCSIAAANYVFGDPCFRTYKYLEVDYECRTTATVRACEGSAVFLSCPSYERIRIITANYGRNAGREVCPHRYIGVTSGCNASSSERKVRAACQGQRSCFVRASNSVFGDPCWRTYKYLEVTYVCYYDYGKK